VSAVDPAGNLVGLLRGTGAADTPVVRVMAHMDELSMIVKRVQPDGTLRLSQLGTMYPGNFGLGPLTVLGDAEQLTAVLLLGSEHTTRETAQVWQTKPDAGDRAMQWDDVYAFTGRTAEELDAAGVHPGTRVCVHHSRRTLVEFGDFVGSYFLDDRAALTALVSAARRLREGGHRPPADAYLVCTTGEEMGGIGAAYASRTLPGDLTLALDVGLGAGRGLRRRRRRLRQAGRRPPDGPRPRAGPGPARGGVGVLRLRRQPVHEQRPGRAGGTAVAADAVHPRLRGAAPGDRRALRTARGRVPVPPGAALSWVYPAAGGG
jgi:putative aminopeptidase FrvX